MASSFHGSMSQRDDEGTSFSSRVVCTLAGIDFRSLFCGDDSFYLAFTQSENENCGECAWVVWKIFNLADVLLFWPRGDLLSAF